MGGRLGTFSRHPTLRLEVNVTCTCTYIMCQRMRTQPPDTLLSTVARMHLEQLHVHLEQLLLHRSVHGRRMSIYSSNTMDGRSGLVLYAGVSWFGMLTRGSFTASLMPPNIPTLHSTRNQ